MLLKKGINTLKEEGLFKFIKKSLALIVKLFRSFFVHLLVKYVISYLSREELKEKHDFIEYGEEENVEITKPCFGDLKPQFENILGEHRFEKPFFSNLKDCYLEYDSGFVFDYDNKIVLEHYERRRDYLERRLANNFSWLLKTIKIRFGFATVDKELDKVVPITGYGYCGWIRSNLTKLQTYEKYKELNEDVPPLLIKEDAPDYVFEWLEALGFEDDIKVWQKNDRVVKADVLILSSRKKRNYIPQYRRELTAFSPNRYYKARSVSPSALNYLRNKIREVADLDKVSKRIFISREDTTERNIVNTEDLLDVIEKEGFEPYQLSNISVKEQIDLFANAEMIIAPHGAGLANTVCSKNCKVIEIFGKKVKPTFFMGAKKLGLDYGPIYGEDRDLDIKVDLKEVENIIDFFID